MFYSISSKPMNPGFDWGGETASYSRHAGLIEVCVLHDIYVANTAAEHKYRIYAVLYVCTVK